MTQKRFYVTTPIYYVNDRPHIGHAYSSVLADVLAGYHRLLGIPTWFLTGTDEHGQKVQESAAARGIPPQELCDEMSQHFRDLIERLEVRNDDFIRTTDERHTSIVTRALAKLHEQGDIYLADYEGWYCTRCERYWTDKEVDATPDQRCPAQPELHDVERLTEKNYYFRMSAYAERLETAIRAGEFRVEPQKRTNEVLGFLAQGLNDLCLSRNRERLDWGVPLPFDDAYVCYVWVDALLNYKSAIGYLADDDAERARHDSWWPVDVHLLGKDILTNHAVYWPTLLLALGEPLPRQLLVHGWLLDKSGRKLSKTKAKDDGGDTRPLPTIERLLDVFGPEATRWFLSTAMKPGDDTNFDWDIVRERVNADLANGLGNTANRLLKMAATTCEGRYPELGEAGERERGIQTAAEEAIAAVEAFPVSLDLASVVGAVRRGVDAISLYLSDERPWKLAKDEATRPRAAEILAWSIEALRLLGLAVTPIVPRAAARLREALGGVGDLDFAAERTFGTLAVGTELGAPPNLFPRVGEDAIPTA